MMKRVDAFYRSRLNGEIGAALLTRLMLRIQHALLRNRMEVAREAGLTNGALFTLFILRSYYPDDHITPRELGEATMMTSGGVTKVLHALVDQGLVSRLQHPSDARSAMIGLTEAGMRLVENILPIVEAKDRALLLDPLTVEERVEFTRLLQKLDAAVGDF